MKNQLYFLTLALCLSFQINAQNKKGDLLIGTSTNIIGNMSSLFNGSLSGEGQTTNAALQFGTVKRTYDFGSISSESKTKVIALNISPNLGVFVSDQTLVGASIGIIYLRSKEEDDDKDVLTIFSFVPHVRAYFKNTGNSLPYFEAKGGIMYAKPKDGESQTAPILAAKVGNSFFISTKVSLDLFAEYNYSWQKDTSDGGNTSKFSAGFFGIGVGLSVFLDKSSGDQE